MSKLSAPRRGRSVSGSQQRFPHPAADPDVFCLSSVDWLARLSLSASYTDSLAPSTHSTSPLTSLSLPSQASHPNLLSDMPAPTFEHDPYPAMDSHLPWPPASLLTPPLHTDASSQGSSPSDARLYSKSPSFQEAELNPEIPSTPAIETKKPKRSRPNRYKNAPPAVIQRRRAANRKSQRAYRKRKDDRIAQLEELLAQATQREQEMKYAYITLLTQYEQLMMLSGTGTGPEPGPSGHHQQHHHPPGHLHHHHHHHHHPHADQSSIITTAASSAATTSTPTPAATSGAEAAESTFMTLATFAPNDGGGGAHHHPHPHQHYPQHPQHPHHHPACTPHLLPIYPPPPM